MWSLRFDQTIGAGAFGTVYLAKLKNDSGLSRPVAVKMITEGHADSEMFLTRMRDEARLLGLLCDPHVLNVLDLIVLEGRDAIVMEYVNGADLDAVVSRSGSLPLRALVEIGATIAAALDRAHRAVHPLQGTPLNVIHRDIKPANIMLTAQGDLRLLDFGVAQARFAARESTTGQLVLGTLNYMAPDYIITGEVHPALDIYGLGLTLWELARGEIFGQPKVSMAAHEKRLDANMAALGPTHAAIEPVLRRMLSFKPEDRPDAAEVSRSLHALLQDLEDTTLEDFAAAAIPPILANRPQCEDTEQLIGRRFQIAPPPAEFTEPTGITQTIADIPEFTEPPVQGIPEGPSSFDEEDTIETRSPPAAPKVLTRHAQPPNSVTMSKAAASPEAAPPSRSSRNAILGGALVGGLVGILAVAGMAYFLID